MTFDEWLDKYTKENNIVFDKYFGFIFDESELEDCWNAAREDLLKELYPLRQTNKEQTNETR